jgi:hypothetical protein
LHIREAALLIIEDAGLSVPDPPKHDLSATTLGENNPLQQVKI